MKSYLKLEIKKIMSGPCIKCPVLFCIYLYIYCLFKPFELGISDIFIEKIEI